jgi:signal transduction histidine kinase
LSLTFKTTKKTIKTNVKLSLGTLQIAMNADKMLQIVNTIATKASAYSSSMKTVSTLLSQYKSMYLGLKFKKK